MAPVRVSQKIRARRPAITGYPVRRLVKILSSLRSFWE